MFTRLRIKNFKAWGDQLWQEGVALAPVTMFLGTNSAGKTSLLQPLLLLRQTFLSTDRTLDLYLGGKKGDLLDLGTYHQVVHDHHVRTELGIGLHIADVRRNHLVVPPDDEQDTDLHTESQQMLNTVEARGTLEYEVTYGHATDALHLRHLKLEHEGLTVVARRGSKGAYKLSASGASASDDRAPANPKREYKPEKSALLPEPARQALNSYRLGTDDLSLAVTRAVERIQYLGPLRERPQSTYLWGGQEPGEIGSRGEDAVPALLANLNAAKKSERGTLVAAVSRWLREMGVADALTVEQIGTSRFYEVMLTTGNTSANLVHVGFGVSQVLPMIVLALTAKEGTTIIAEQPEIHLHPRAQTVLANLLVETAKQRKLQFLIETHSEHLFRRLQFLVADEQLTKKDCRLYFVNRTESGEPALEHLALDDYGRVSNWPDDFFGDAIGEVERQMDRMMARRRKERASE